MGISARQTLRQRDETLVSLAKMLERLGEENEELLRSVQKEFQYAFVLSCDSGVYETLSAETIEVIDNALESLFTIEDISRDLRWEPLVYAYAFFNRDVSVDEIVKVRDSIRALPDDQRRRMYPIYPHGFDALVKPLAMGHLADPTQTAPALEAAIPLLREFVLSEARPGRAFHPPSHGVIVLAAIYNRWADTNGPEGEVVRDLLGTRDEFVAMLESRMLGGVPNPADLPDFHYRFYAFDGQYFANALARLDARDAVDTLNLSLELYNEHVSHPALINYTKRALVTLGDPEARVQLEESLSGPDNQRAVDMLGWICRNAKGEGIRYATGHLAAHFDCEPHEALNLYFNSQLEPLAD